jgi:hypothetical protein
MLVVLGMVSVDRYRKMWPMAVELLVVGLVVALVAVLVRVISSVRRGREPRGAVSEAQARENAAPLTRAVMARADRDRGRGQ